MERCIVEGWSKSVLVYQMDTDLYTRQVKNEKHNNIDLLFYHVKLKCYIVTN